MERIYEIARPFEMGCAQPSDFDGAWQARTELQIS